MTIAQIKEIERSIGISLKILSPTKGSISDDNNPKYRLSLNIRKKLFPVTRNNITKKIPKNKKKILF